MNKYSLFLSRTNGKQRIWYPAAIIGLLIIGLLLLAGCNGDAPTVPPPGLGISLEITADNCPNTVINPNQQATWTVGDDGEYTVVDVTGNGSVLFDADTLHQGDSFSYIFINPGTYEYICTKDGNSRGQITVE
jgi:hypothetical protein